MGLACRQITQARAEAGAGAIRAAAAPAAVGGAARSWTGNASDSDSSRGALAGRKAEKLEPEKNVTLGSTLPALAAAVVNFKCTVISRRLRPLSD